MKKYGFVFLSAILITLSLYPFNLSFLAFVFFIPAFYGITLSKSLKERIFLSITFGFSVFLLNFFWAIKTMEFYGKLPSWLSYLLGIPLSIYQTLPFILLLLSFPYLIKKSIILPALLFPILTNLLPLIFPYSISSTLSAMPVLCKTAEIWGEWGLDFIIILINTLFFKFLISKNKKYSVAATGLIVILPVYYFISTAMYKEKPFSYLEAIIIQPCIYDGDSPETKRNKFFTMLKKVENKIKNKILIIPESALPDDISLAKNREEIMRAILNKLKPEAILYNTFVIEKNRIYNTNILLSETTFDRYDKNKLMLFGEYFPFHSLIQKLPLPIANYENFTRGRKVKPLKYKKINISTPICLESIYQGYTAKLSKNANVIVNPTDDEWFLSKKVKMLHFAQVRIKSIENNRFLVTATNNGYTAIIDNKGKIVKDLPLEKEGYLTARIPLLKRETLFQRIYIIFPYLFTILFITLLTTGKHETGNNS